MSREGEVYQQADMAGMYRAASDPGDFAQEA